MEKNLKVGRIDNILKDRFGEKIDMSNTSDPLYSSCYYSRAIAATAIIDVNRVDFDTAAKAITDGGNDMGIDAIYVNKVQKVITFVQAKHHDKGTKGISKTELSALEEGITNILNSNYEEANHYILSHRDELEQCLLRDDYRLSICIAYTGAELNASVKKKFDKIIDSFNKDGTDFASGVILDLNKLYDFVVVNQFKEKLKLENFCIEKLNHFENPQNAYFGLVSGATLAKLYKDNGNSIFSSNIRYFKGDTTVNEGIEEVIKTKSDKFVLFNNGVKVICDKITRLPLNKTSYDVGYFNIEGFSIVNGAQTTGSLSKFSESELEKVKVFITIISLEGNDDEELANDITRLSNTQNKIEFIDFATLDPFHLKLKKDLLADGKNYSYVDGDNGSQDGITLYDLTNAICCYKSVELSAYVKNGYNKIFKDIKSEQYKGIFNQSVTQYFAWNVTTYYTNITKLVIARSVGAISLDYAIPVHGTRFVVHCIFEKLWNSDSNIDNKYLDFEDDKDKIGILLDKLLPLIKEAYVDLYNGEIVANVFRAKKKSIKVKKSVFEKYKEKYEQTSDSSDEIAD